MAGAYGLIEKVHAASALRTAFDGSALIYRVHILTVRPERLTRALARVCIIASIPLVLAHSVVSTRVGHAGILLAGFQKAAVSTAVPTVAVTFEPEEVLGSTWRLSGSQWGQALEPGDARRFEDDLYGFGVSRQPRFSHLRRRRGYCTGCQFGNRLHHRTARSVSHRIRWNMHR